MTQKQNVVIEKCSSRQDSIEKLIAGLLRQEPMTTRQLVDCLMSKPCLEANITVDEIWLALLNLQSHGLLGLSGFSRRSVGSLDIEPILKIVELQTNGTTADWEVLEALLVRMG